MAGGCGEAPVAREQRRVKRLGQRDIGGVIGRQIVAQLPNARQKEIMPISPQGKVREVGKGQSAALPSGGESLDFAKLRGDEIGEGARGGLRGPAGGQDHMDV